MQTNTAFKFAPVFSEDRKIDVTLRDGEAEIRLSTWENDLGWCGQKTLSLDPSLLDELHRVITAARCRLKREAAEASEEASPVKVLQFPGAA